jgi:lipocalin
MHLNLVDLRSILDFHHVTKLYHLLVGDYWILALGPIVDGKYQYSVVSEPRKLMMWVLARDPQDYINIHETTVKPRVVDEFGYNHLWNKYRERSHEGCTPYEQE